MEKGNYNFKLVIFQEGMSIQSFWVKSYSTVSLFLKKVAGFTC